jgi:hypothetical protein
LGFALGLSWGTFWAIGIAERTETLGSELRTTAGKAQATIGSADGDAVVELGIDLAATAPRARELRNDLWPLRAVGSVAGWIPFIGDNITAAPNLADRLTIDVEAVLGMINAAERLLRIYDQLPQESIGISATLGALPDKNQIHEIRSVVLTSDADLKRAEIEAAGIKDGRLWWRLETEARELRSQEDDLRELIDWMLLATDSLSALASLSEATDGLATLLDSGNSSELTGEDLRYMPELERAAAAASITVSAAVTAAPSAVLESPIGINLRDLEPVLEALHVTAVSGSLVSEIAIPAFKAVETAGDGLFGPNSGLLESISLIGLRVDELREAQISLAEARSRLAHSISSIETPSAKSAAETLLLLSREFELALGLLSDLPELAPDALGANGQRRYLMLAESADEIRAAGGFVSGAWILTFDDGSLVQAEYRDVVEVDDLNNLADYPAPPELLANHMDAPMWLLRDVGWEPDFPSVASSAAEILAIGQDELHLDGVIAVTQWAMLDFAEALGSIETADGPLAAEELLKVLESGTDYEGREFMNTLLQGILAQVSSPSVDGRMFQLASVASKTLTEKQTLVHLFDEKLQNVVEHAGWGGVASGGPGDRIVPIDSNVGWSKVDRNIQRELDYVVTLNPNGRSTGVVTVRYENLSGQSASSCDRQRMERGVSYEQLKNACYWNLVRLYISDGASLVSATPQPLPENSVYAELGLGAIGDDTVRVGAGPSGNFVTALLTVPAGEVVEASFVLELSDTAVDWTDRISTYTLNLAAQPGARGRATNIQINLPRDYVYSGGSITPTLAIPEAVYFDLPLREDTDLTVTMRLVDASGDLGENDRSGSSR